MKNGVEIVAITTANNCDLLEIRSQPQIAEGYLGRFGSFKVARVGSITAPSGSSLSKAPKPIGILLTAQSNGKLAHLP